METMPSLLMQPPSEFRGMVGTATAAPSVRNVHSYKGMPLGSMSSSVHGRASWRALMRSVLRISVVIPTKDSGRTLERCLMCVREQTYDSVEVVVVDAGSTDQTKAIASHLADHVYELR